MTSHQPPKQPTPLCDTPAGAPRIEWVEQPNGDRIPATFGPPAARRCCGVIYHAQDLLFARCEG